MKIIVRSKEEKNITLLLPSWLVYGRLTTRIATAAIARHAPNCGVSPQMLAALLTALRDFARTHPHWKLVDIITHDGNIIKITL